MPSETKKLPIRAPQGTCISRQFQCPVSQQEQNEPCSHKTEVRTHGGCFFLETLFYVTQFFHGFVFSHQAVEDGQCLFRLSTHYQVTGRFRNKHQQGKEEYGRNNFRSEHPSPSNRVQPGSIALQGNRIIHKINDQHTEDDRKLVPRNQVTTTVCRSNLGNVHRRNHRSQTDPDTCQEYGKPQINTCKYDLRFQVIPDRIRARPNR